MDVILKTNKLTKKFKETLALDQVNMTINRGDIYGFVGENGAGKSTLFKVITNIINKTSGEFTLNIDNRLGSLAAIIENPAIHESLNAVNNLKFQSNLLNLNKTEADFKAILNLVGLGKLFTNKKKSKNFSLGMKQRLSIAMALLSEPEFILLDEPMNGLDPLGIKHMRDLILKLNEEKNVTFLISSHILMELDKVATKYGFINNGRLLKEITAKELRELTKPKTRIRFEKTINKDLQSEINKYNHTIIDEVTIDFEDINDQGSLIRSLNEFNNTIINITQIEKDLESYYLEIIEGNTNEEYLESWI